MKTSVSTIVFFLVALSISAISLAKESPVEGCIRKNIGQAITPSPSDKPTTSNLKLGDQLCKDETRIVMYFLKRKGKFPRYYLKAMCNVFGNDETKVKDYVSTKWLNHSEKLLSSLSCITRTTLVIEKNIFETCIRRNIDGSTIGEDSCMDLARNIMYFLEMYYTFPLDYVKALCNIFDDEEKKVKEYVGRIGFLMVRRRSSIL